MARANRTRRTTPGALPRSSSSVLLAGGTGLVGRELTQLLLAARPAPAVHQLVRRVPDAAEARATWHRVDFAALPQLPKAREAYCCLGTTIRQAGSQEAFRAVDFEAVLAFARAARAAGVSHFAVVSALGANARAATFYNRVKGEMEDAVRAIGFDSLVIARPSLLAGDRAATGQPLRTGERFALALTTPFAALIPKRVRPIQARTLACGMIRALHQRRPGVRVVESAELQELGRP
jgi:uncharacterized protein YbjT (DUF2867 family)